MRDIATATLSGNLTRDVELKALPSGTHVAPLRGATTTRRRSYRDREPEHWQLLHDLHEQFHRNAAQVLELAVSGRAKEADARLEAREFTEVERQLQDALQRTAAAAA
ncbi:MAG TPA: hypothetical protein VMU39_19925 [Solirubrobacteraceae bacterium]|nr:hypothetical protein [Solirubrobacteraceae bacterium]